MALFTKEESLAYHEEPRPGKLEVLPVKPCFTQKDLSMAYSPGVANACLAIADDPSLANAYTGRGNLVAVVQVRTPTDLTKKQLLEVASIVAERTMSDEGDGADEAEEGPEGAAKEPGVGSKLKEEIEEEVAEHFSSDKWHTPKNPFKGKGKRK